jgi:aminocarboxymuconate-semialdehyde decarboxylase
MAVDMHAHYVPPKVLTMLDGDPETYGVHMEDATGGIGRCACFNYGLRVRPFYSRLLDLEERWQEMERQGVDREILSVWADLFGTGMPAELGARWHRALNETLSETAQNHPQRLSMLASVPLQDADRAATELEYGVKQCGAVGGVIAANVDGTNLGDAPLDNLWAAAVDLDVPLFIHPTHPITARTGKYDLNVSVQYVYDTTVTVGSLILSGVLDRFPNLNLVLSHGGGFFPYQAGRFDRLYRNIPEPRMPIRPPSEYLRRFYYDTITHSGPALRYLCDLVGSDRVLLGTDYPFPVADHTPLKYIEEAGCAPVEVSQITNDNARQLFKL